MRLMTDNTPPARLPVKITVLGPLGDGSIAVMANDNTMFWIEEDGTLKPHKEATRKLQEMGFAVHDDGCFEFSN